MASAITESATWETSIIGPDGTDVINVSGIRNGLQDLANRTLWLAGSIVDVKYSIIAPGNDYANITFASMTGSSTLTFTNVNAGDKIVLFGSMSLACGAFIADGSDPGALARWYVDGTTDVYLSVSGYPTVGWGATVNTIDVRSLTAPAVHTVTADAASLTAALQLRVFSASFPISTEGPVVLVGIHTRNGIA